VGDGALGMTEAADPEGALTRWLGDEAPVYVVLPLDGFSQVRRTGHWALFAHEVASRPKVVLLVADVGEVPLLGRWSATGFAACDASEFNPAARLGYDIQIWNDHSGRVSTSRLLDREDCYGGRALRIEGRLFVRDPTGDAFDPAELFTTYRDDASLPVSAEPSEYREGDRRLYFASDGSAAFIESPESVERWPRVRGDEYMRTDCN
jgi:hypothetical protein